MPLARRTKLVAQTGTRDGQTGNFTAMQGFLRTYADTDLQRPMDAAVVIPTLLRPHLAQALASIFAQNFAGRIHILVGVDTPQGDLSAVDAACAGRPSHCAVQVFWPGYSTAARHGGLTPSADGGALRCVLSFLANSAYVAYLDDDNWWGPDHLQQLRTAVEGAEWGFTLRWFVHPDSRRPVCVDSWESVGPGEGMFKEKFGGFVDPNCLMINKLACPQAPLLWNFPLANAPLTADRNVFNHLSRQHKWQGTGKPSTFYMMNKTDGLHPMRMQIMGEAYVKAGEPAPAPQPG
jgi:hypothetical protein